MHKAGLPESCAPLVTQSTRASFGDYQSNGVLPAAKQLRENPRDLAQRVVEQIDRGDLFDKIEIAGPGFINLFLRREWINNQCEALNPGQGILAGDAAETIVVDYSAPNLAKEMHVGHLRSTIIGDSVARVLQYLGNHIIRQNHMGDWGTQFGMLIAELEELVGEEQQVGLELADLEAFYRRAKLHFDKSAEFADRAREYVVKLQSGDAHCLALWRQFIDISVAHCIDIYTRLNVTLAKSDIKPESAYNDDLPVIVASLKDQNLAVIDQGAVVVFLQELAGKEGNPSPVIVQKSDSGYLYATTDLAALRFRADVLKANRILYFVDARQSLHLKQVFAVARNAKFVPESISLEHLAFGTMMGADGKPFKTRSGGTIKLAELLDEAIERASVLVSEKNPELSADRQLEIANKVGIGAVKYADLSKNIGSDYVFNWDSILSFEGNTAPYLQYAYTRIKSLFRRADRRIQPTDRLDISEPRELALGIKLLQFRETLDLVAKECTPNILCNYLYELSGEFMSFYESVPVLKEDVDPQTRNSRLLLCDRTAAVLEKGLELLGIEVMDQM